MLDELGLSSGGLAWCGAVLFVAALVRGYSGFGFSSVLMAGLTFVFPATAIVPLSIALEVVASSGQAKGIWRHIDRPHLTVLLVAGLIGNPIGVYLLAILPDEQLRLAILLFIAAASLILLCAPRHLFNISTPVYAIAGFTAGVVNGATALSGLFLALFFTLTGVRPAVMRATMIAYFFVTDVWTGGLLISSGFFGHGTVLAILLALPLLGLGVWLGSNRFFATPPDSFRTYVLWLLLLLCTIGLLRIGLSR